VLESSNNPTPQIQSAPQVQSAPQIQSYYTDTPQQKRTNGTKIRVSILYWLNALLKKTCLIVTFFQN
jgi:hypothetical protein